MGADSTSTPPAAGEDWPLGSAIGPYRLIRKIGEGGMGSVLLAARSDQAFQKQVAIKFFRLGPERPELLERFRAERQILASLDHPWVAKLLDGGSTERGTPYFVMEYVEGLPIDAYCDSKRLAIGERLELFRKVCSAVQHAHTNLIVHRDIKPSNILVRGDGEPKLLDFGIAKLLDPEGPTPGADPTQVDHPLMTPAYASPEQVRGEPITTAADVYSLGVLLYELLAGRRPHDLERRTPPEVLQAIAEEAPPPPSAAVTAAGAASRAGTVAALRRRLRGDLDNIALKALRKEPARRYSSVEQFSEDVRRHLSGLPVAARPDTPGYRAGKFVRRHRLGVAAAAAFVAVVASFGAVTAVQSRRLALALTQAQKEAAKAKSATRFLQQTLGAANPFGGVGREATVLEVLRRAHSTLEESFAGQPETEATVRATLGATYLDLDRLDDAEPQLTKALAVRRRVLGPEHPDVVESLVELGRLLTEKGELERSERLLRDALAMATSLFGPESLEVSDVLYRLGKLLLRKGEYAPAEDVLRRCLVVRRRLLPPTDVRVARPLRELCAARLWQGDPAGAEALCREALAITEEASPPGGAEVAAVLHALATVLDGKGDLTQAEPIFRKVLAIRRTLLGEQHTSVAESLLNLAAVQSQRGLHEEAVKLDREALAIFRAVLGKESREAAAASMNLAIDLLQLGRMGEAEELIRGALAAHRRVWKGGHEDIANGLDILGGALVLQKRYGEAEKHYREALALKRSLLGAEHPSTAQTLTNLASALHHKGERRAAAPLFQEAVEILARKLPPNHPELAICRSDYGALLTDLGRREEAREQLVVAYAALLKVLGREHAQTKAAAGRLLELSRRWEDPKARAEIRALLGT
jgi:serine/threonine-protein kinase